MASHKFARRSVASLVPSVEALETRLLLTASPLVPLEDFADSSPVYFESSPGQTESGVVYVARGGSLELSLLTNGTLVGFGGLNSTFAGPASDVPSSVLMTWQGANDSPSVIGLGSLSTDTKRSSGDDRAIGETSGSNFARVLYDEVYTGIDLEFYGRGRDVEFDWIVAPGVDPAQIAMVYAGMDSLVIDVMGNLVVTTGGQNLIQHTPVVYQVIDGGQHTVAGSYQLRDDGTVGFALGNYDPNLPLVIDPVLSYSTYLGGDRNDSASGIAVDADGNTYVIGTTSSTGFAQVGDLDANVPRAFVSKFNADGELVYTIPLGPVPQFDANGYAESSGRQIVMDHDGSPIVTFVSLETQTIPLGGGEFLPLPGPSELHVVKLSPEGLPLFDELATVQDVPELNEPTDFVNVEMAVDATGAVLVSYGAVRDNLSGGTTFDPYIAKFSSDGSREFTQSLFEVPAAVAVDDEENIYLAFSTARADLPVTIGAYQSVKAGGEDGSVDVYVAMFDSTATGLLGATYLGGSHNDAVSSLAVRPDQPARVYLAGGTLSDDFPLTNAFEEHPTPGTGLGDNRQNGFLALLDFNVQDAGQLVAATYFGGSRNDLLTDIALDEAGQIYVVGQTNSLDLPTDAPLIAEWSVGPLLLSQGIAIYAQDHFVAKFNSTLTSLLFSTYFGGSGDETVPQVAIGPDGIIHVVGTSAGRILDADGVVIATADFPTVNAHQLDFGGGVIDFDTQATDAVVYSISQRGVIVGHGSRTSQGHEFTSNVADLANAALNTDSADYAVTIRWGDDKTSAGDLVQPDPNAIHFQAVGTHLYEFPGAYPVIAQLENMQGGIAPLSNINVAHFERNQTGGAIAINPTNPLQLSAAMTSEPAIDSDPPGILVATSVDGGQTWSPRLIANGNDDLPEASGNPDVVFDDFGNLFLAYEGTDNNNIVVLWSTDGGRTFDALNVAELTPAGSVAGGDTSTVGSPKLAFGGSLNEVWVTFEDLTSGRIAAAGASIGGLGDVGPFVLKDVSGSAGGVDSDITIGPNGEVAVVWQVTDNTGITLIVSSIDVDGLGVGIFTGPSTISISATDGELEVPAQQAHVSLGATVAWDTSDGPHRGRLYVSFVDLADDMGAPGGSGTPTVFVTYSDDWGVNWATPQSVTHDPEFESMFLPSIAIDSTTGNVGVGWYGTRDATSFTNFFVATSADGIQSSGTQKVSVEPSNTLAAGVGDYAMERGYGAAPGMAFLGGRLYPIWSDNSSLQDENYTFPEFDMATAIIGVIDVAPAPVAIRPMPVAALLDQEFTGTVATFTHPDPSRTVADYTLVNIQWGDGENSSGMVTQPGGPGTEFVVTGTHTYLEAGSFPLWIQVHDNVSGIDAIPVSNVTAQPGSQVEPTIAVDPSNPDRVFAAGNHATIQFRGISVAASDDGGVTWTSGTLADGNDGLPRSIGDPRAVFDQFGNLFLTYLTPDPDRYVVVLLSTDGGRNFTLLATFTDIDKADQPSIAVGPGEGGMEGSVWLTWERGDSPFQIIMAAGAPVHGLGGVGGFSQHVVAPLSVDGFYRNFGDISVGPDGQVLLAYVKGTPGANLMGPAEIFVHLDPDGLGSDPFGPPVLVTDVNVGSFLSIPAQATRTIDSEGNLAWDRSDGAHRGRVYLVYTDSGAVGSADTDVFIRASDDGGLNWGEPIQVNDDDILSQFLPSVAVDQTTGNVGVGWYTAVDAANVRTQFTATLSDDGGSTFRLAYLVSPGDSDATAPSLDIGGQNNQRGDYTSLAFVEGVLQPIWADNSDELEAVPDPRRFDLANARIAVATVSRTPLVVDGSNVEGVQGAELDVEVATFTDPDGGTAAADFSATIDWGDGTEPSDGEITQAPDGSFAVSGMHEYLTYGNFTVMTTIVGPHTRGQAESTATIENAPLVVAVADDLRVVRETTFTKDVGTLTDDNPHSVAADFDVTINWGDGTFSMGTLELDDNQEGHVFKVTGTHKYLSESIFTLTISARETESGQVLTENGQIASGDPSLSAEDFFLDVDALAGINTGDLVLATFVPGDDNEAPLDTHLGEYLATINWGDGQVDTNIIPFVTSEDVTITGRHTYAVAGDYFPSITLVDDSGGEFHVSLIARVSSDVTSSVTPVGTGLIYNPLSERWVGEITVTNTGTEPLRGPIHIVIDDLPEGVTLEDVEDVNGDGDPVLTVSLLSLAPGASLDPITVEFSNPDGGPITYTARVFAPLETSTLGLASLTFEPNLGQTDADVAFVSRGSNYAVYLTEQLAAVQVLGASESAAVYMGWVGGNDSPNIVGLRPLVGTSNYFSGSDPAAWVTDVPNYGRVRYESVYDGVDLEYYGRDGQLEFDWIVQPGADSGMIVMEFAGASEITVDHEGNLRLQIGDGQLVERAPVVYQVIAGQTQIVNGRYVVHADDTVGFELGMYDDTTALIIDPVLLYSTYFGGPGTFGTAVAVDEAGNAYVTGSTLSLSFPTSVGAFQEQSIDESQIIDPLGSLIVPQDAFVVKFAPNGAPIYSTYLSGNVGDAGVDIVVDAEGQVYVLGVTRSPNFPTRAAFQPTISGGIGPLGADEQDAFLTKLSADGSRIIYSTFLGGESLDLPRSLTIDASGAAYVVGGTFSRTSFPILNAVQPQHAFDLGLSGVFLEDGFLTKVDPSGSSLLFSTYLGGGHSDYLNGVVLDDAGNIIVVGSTTSNDLPTQNALQESLNGILIGDMLLAKLSADGSTLDVLSYLGGSGNDEPFDIARDRDGNIVIAGRTDSTDFPTVNPFQGSLTDPLGDGFITVLNSALSQILYSTYLGGNSEDGIRSVGTDDLGNILVFGYTQSTDLPVVAPLQASLAGGLDGWVASLSPATNTVSYLTYFGGTANEFGLQSFLERGGNAMAVDSHGNFVLTGFTPSFDFPTYNSTDHPTSSDVPAARLIVARIASVPPPGFNRLQLLNSAFSGQEGADFSGVVASFVAVGQEQAGDFTATVDWGDGTVSDGTVVASTATTILGRHPFNVLGSHVYEDLGQYDVLVTVRNTASDMAVAPETPAAADATVATDHVKYHVSIDTSTLAGQAGFFSAQFNPGTLPFTVNASLQVFNFAVSGGTLSPAIFIDGSALGSFDGGAMLSPLTLLNRLTQGLTFGSRIDFDVLVTGDAISNPTLGLFGQSVAFQLLAADRITPLLAADPTGAVVTINVDPDGSTHSRAKLPSPTATRSAATASAFNVAQINNAPLAASLTPIAVQEGSPFTGNVATFTNANPFEVTLPHEATIDWGDGTVDAGLVVFDSGEFQVIGTHTYRIAGAYTLTAVITEPDGASATVETSGGGNHIEASRLVIVGDIVGGSGTVMATGDFNGDGHLDVVSGVNNHKVLITFGNGDLSFQPSINVTTLTNSEAAATGDFNGDGVDDIVIAGLVTTTGTAALNVIFGSNTGGPQTAPFTTALQTVFSPRFLASGDFDGDGKLDVAITYFANGSPNVVVVMRGHGDGSFDAPQNYTVDFFPSGVASGDLNDDGFDDLVVSNSSVGNIRVLLGSTGGMLTALPPMLAGGAINSLAIDDINVDGIPDLVGAVGNLLLLMTGNGDGSFSATWQPLTFASSHVATGDLNGDGLPDVVLDDALSTVKLLLAQADGTFVETQSIPTASPQGVGISDVDHDGRLDVLVQGNGGLFNSLRVFPGRGDGTAEVEEAIFTGSNLQLQQQTADVNGDGFIDLISNIPTGVLVTLGRGDGTFDTAETVPFGTGSTNKSVAIADFDGDGLGDIVVATSTGLGILFGSADGTFHNGYSTFLSSSFDVAVGDVNGDGLPDIVTSLLSDNFAVVLNLGGGAFTTTQFIATSTGARSILLQDLNGDGNLDVAVHVSGPYSSATNSYPSAGVQVFHGLGDGTFLSPVLAPAGVPSTLYPGGIAAGDLNGDSILDLVVTSASGPQGGPPQGVSVLLGNPDGSYEIGDHYFSNEVANVSWSVTLSDFDRDGNLDAAIGRTFSSTIDRLDDVVLLFGNGDGTFQAPVGYDAGFSPGMIRSGDINDDGALDLVVGESVLGGQGVGVLLNRGDGTFAPMSFYSGGFSSNRIALGDLDQDGRLDIVTGNFQSATLGLLYGRGDGTLIAQYASPIAGGIKYLVAGDANDDGILDVAYTNGTDNGVGLLIGRGDGHFNRQPAVIITPNSPVDLAFADIDNNGQTDLVVGTRGGIILSLPVLTDGSLGSATTRSSGAAGNARFAFADFNGDGRLDAVRLANSTVVGTLDVAVLIGQADSSFVNLPQRYPAGMIAVSTDLVAADFNHDGRLDLVLVSTGTNDQNNTGGGVYVLIGLGNGTFAPPVLYDADVPYQAVTTADLNGDTFDDLVLVRLQSNFKPDQRFAVMYSRGDGTFDPPLRFHLNSNGVSGRITTGDFSGDGFPDIVAGSSDLFVHVINNIALPAGAVVANAPVDLMAADLNVPAGTMTSAIIGSFTDNNPFSNASDFTAVIQWGDGQSSAGTIEKLPDGSYQIGGSHSYAAGGTFNTSITLDEAMPFTRYTATGTAVVSAVTLDTADAGPDQSLSEGTTVMLEGTFVGSDPLDTPTFLWHITSSNGQTVVDGNSATFSFVPSDNGTYTATLTVTTPGGVNRTDSATISVSNALPSVVLGDPGSGKYGQELSFSLTAQDPSAADVAAGFAYVINWGDGTPDTTVSRVAGNATGLNVSHIFASAGQFSVEATGTDKDNGASAVSAVLVTVDKAHLQVTVDDKTKVYGTVIPTLTAMISGFQNGETLATSGVTGQPLLTLVGDGIHVGEYVITAALGSLSAANYDFPAASSVSGVLNVTPASLTVTAVDTTKAYGAPLPDLTANVTGFVNGDSPAVLTTQPVLTTSATSASHVGSYSITASAASAGLDYEITYVPGVLTVTPVVLTITAENKSKLYGAAMVSLTAAFDGFVNGDTSAALTIQPLLATSATAASHVGTYAITVSGAVDSDYTFVYLSGTLAITPASLQITAQDKNKVYGAALVPLTAAYDGLVNGDTPADLTTAPILATTATTASDVGSYPITLGGAADPDYTISFNPGTFAITPAPLTIRADDKIKAPGSLNPTLTFTPIGFVNGDTVASLTTQPTLTTTATTSSPAGSYSITASDAASLNYSIAYIAGTLIVNAPPVAMNDAASTQQNTAVLIDVLGNDSDADGTLDPTSVAVVGAASHGSTSVNPVTGIVIYTPVGNYSGPDSFTYTVNDNAGAVSNIASVSITVTADTFENYKVVVKTDLSKPKEGGSALPIKLQVFNSAGKNVSSPALPVRVLGIGISVDQPVDTLMPASDAGNSNPGGLFRSIKGAYVFDLKLVDGSGRALKQGTYYLYFTIGDDPTLRTLAFSVKEGKPPKDCPAPGIPKGKQSKRH